MSGERVERALAAVAAREPDVHAFAWLGAERARAAAAVASGPLAGLPIGVKDIIDTAGIPTERGSPLFAGRVPERTATVVRRAEAAGAVVLGKTVTAELAFAHPGPTRNPWNLERTPGGSSMGSAAAIAAGMLTVAFGTQTNSSIVMPASLCGVVGYKPSAGRSTLDGVMPFSPTLDEVGLLGASVADVLEIAPVLGGPLPLPADAGLDGLRVAVALGPGWPDASDAVADQVARVLARLSDAGARIDVAGPPAAFEPARAIHRTIMAFEAWQCLGADVLRAPELASGVLRRFLAEGRALTVAAHDAALAERAATMAAFDRFAAAADVIVCPGAPDEAPDAAGTGDPRFCTLWTLVGAPCVALPAGRGPAGLPLGLQLIGKRGDDARLLALARAVEPIAAG